MIKFPEFIYIPLDVWIDAAVEWITIVGDSLFDSIGKILLAPMVQLERLLLAIPWFIIILLIAFLAWRATGWKLAVGVVLGLVFIGSLGLWEASMKTPGNCFVCHLIGHPFGCTTGYCPWHQSNKVKQILHPVLDMMQTMPSFVYLIPALMLFGLGKVPALISVLIYAIPPPFV